MIIRLVLLFIVVALLLWILKRLFSGNPTPAKIEEQEASTSEDMRQCKYCGIHVPESSILLVNDQSYCCQEHADSDQ
jgi:uncharacterized protein